MKERAHTVFSAATGSRVIERRSVSLRDVERIPLCQRSQIHNLQRDGVAPPADGGVVCAVLFVLEGNGRDLLLRRLCGKEVAIRPSPAVLRSAHRVASVEPIESSVISRVDELVRVVLDHRLRSIGQLVRQIAAIIVFARNLLHDIIEIVPPLPPRHPLMRSIGLIDINITAQIEPRSARRRQLLPRLRGTAQQLNRQIVDHAEAVQRHVALQRVAQHTIFPVGHDRERGIHQIAQRRR